MSTMISELFRCRYAAYKVDKFMQVQILLDNLAYKDPGLMERIIGWGNQFKIGF